jgi:hypothetical protein
MFRKRKLITVAIVVAAGLTSAPRAQAGPILDWLGLGNDAPSSYSPLHFWAPNVTRTADHFGPRVSIYAPERHPEVPPTTSVQTYPTSVATPAETLIFPPTPPATSTAR